MTKSQSIIGIQVSDLILTCGFSENYAKNLHQFIEETFNYEDFDVEINGVSTMIKLNSYSEIQLIFKKKTIKNRTEVQILSLLFDEVLSDSYYNFVSFCQMLQRFKDRLKNLENVDIQDK